MTKKKQIIFSSLLGVVLLVLIFMPKTWDAESLDEVEVTDSTEVKEIVYRYGIPVDDYDVDFGVVKKNQSLSVILQAHGLSSKQIHDLDLKAKGVFDLKRIRSGQAYAVFSTQDSLPAVEYVVYENSPRDYVIFDLKGDYKVSMGQNPVEWRKKEVKGNVQSSLWNSMIACDSDPLLAVKLSEIFGWTIDFFGLRKDDQFRVLYDQEYVDGQSLPNFIIKGAVFRHADSNYYAIPFLQGGDILYFNENGKSLEGAFLKAPLDFFRISSRFTNSRYHPVLKRYRAHHGVDYAAPVGTPVYAIGSGTVVAKGYQAKGGGNFLKIKHNGTYVTSYMHLSRFADGIKIGKSVAQKQIIGYVGSTGLSTGPHLDFRVYENSKPINPLTIKSQPKDPVKSENMVRFTVLRDSIVKQLAEIQVKENAVVLSDSAANDSLI